MAWSLPSDCKGFPERPGKVMMKDVTERLQPTAVWQLIQEDYNDAIQRIADALEIDPADLINASVFPDKILRKSK